MDLCQLRELCTHQLDSYPAKIKHPSSNLSCPLISGLSFLPSRNKKLSSRYPFRTGIYASNDASDEYFEPVYGRSWHVDFRYMFGPIPETDKLNYSRMLIANSPYGEFEDHFVFCGPEVLIFARDVEKAQLIADAINVCTFLANGELLLPMEDVTVARDEYFGGDYGGDLDLPEITLATSTNNIYHSIRVMQRIMTNQTWYRALLRLCHSARIFYIHPMDYHPSYPRYWPAVHAEKKPREFTAMALAITAAYSALEELGLNVELRGLPLLKDGMISPSARSEISRLLLNKGLNPDRKIIWLKRGASSLVERKSPKVNGRKTNWSRSSVRDHFISLVDAVAYCKWIRNKAGAHKTSDLTQTLRHHDLTNVQSCVRDILLDLVDCPWPEHNSNNVLSQAIREC